MKYEAVLTHIGETLLTQAYQTGTPLVVTHMAIGDGNGAPVIPDKAATVIAGEFDIKPLGWDSPPGSILGGGIEYASSTHIGRIIRTLGLIDTDGNLIAYANYPDTPVIPPGTLYRDLRLEIQIKLVNGSVVTVLTKSSMVEVFTKSGTWHKPAGAESIHLLIVGGGAGGSNGAVGTPSSNLAGGAGGGGGGVTEVIRPAVEFGTTAAVTVGKGGAGAAAGSGPSTSGSPGGHSNVSTAINGRAYTAYGGSGRLGGKALFNGGDGGSASSGNVGGAGSTTGQGSTGGGAGGGIGAGAYKNGGPPALPSVHGAGMYPSNLQGRTDGEPGVDISTHAIYGSLVTGIGAGGGASSVLGDGGRGGHGNNGGGGGGGGAAYSPFLSGAGGNGGDGIVIITTYF